MVFSSKNPVDLAVVLLMVVGLLTLLGCHIGTKDNAPALQHQGEIDTSATPQTQAKQKVIQRLLNAIQEGASDKGSLAIHAPGVDFREAESKFLDGHAWLARWNFDGPVVGNSVPVVLYFTDREFDFGDPQSHFESRRVYSVVGSGSKITISRVK